MLPFIHMESCETHLVCNSITNCEDRATMSAETSTDSTRSVTSSPVPPLTKEEVKEKLQKEEYVLVSRAEEASPVWKSFSAVHCALTNAYVGFVECNTCKFIYSFKKGASSSTLLRHRCVYSSKSNQNEQAALVTSETKAAIADGCVQLCARDLRSFNIVKGEGFRALAQQLLDVGAEYAKIGQVIISDVLPHPTTICRRICDAAEKVRNEFTPQLRQCLADRSCAFDADLWTEKYTKIHYLTITCIYITRDWKMKSQVLCTSEFPNDEAKTGENIRKEILSELEQYGISEEDLQNAVFVTDQGSNIKLALSPYRRLPCVAHCLSTVLRHTLDEEKVLKFSAPGVLNLLKACKNLVSFFKRTGLSKNLKSTVKLMIETRWNTVVDMIESVSNVVGDVAQVLLQRGEMHRLDGWNGELATDLIQFLSKFRDITLEMQAKKHPTLHFILVRYHELLAHCAETVPSQSPEMDLLRKRARELVIEKLEIEDEHFVAAFLCPNIRNLKNLSACEREKVHDLIRSFSKSVNESHPGTLPSVSTENRDSITPATTKSKFGDWAEEEEDTPEQLDSCLEDEMKLYSATGKAQSEDPNDLLSWWKSRERSFPNLSRLARHVFAIPATNASAERNFSRAGLVVSEKRSTVGPQNVNDILVMHNYYLGETVTEKDTIPLQGGTNRCQP